MFYGIPQQENHRKQAPFLPLLFGAFLTAMLTRACAARPRASKLCRLFHPQLFFVFVRTDF
jgi:hypothetical protein